MSDFPTRSDVTIKVVPAFAIDADEHWCCVGIGRLGMIVKASEEPPPGEPELLRWLGQVVKFEPQAEYLGPQAITDNLRERGVTGVDWRIQ